MKREELNERNEEELTIFIEVKDFVVHATQITVYDYFRWIVCIKFGIFETFIITNHQMIWIIYSK